MSFDHRTRIQTAFQSTLGALANHGIRACVWGRASERLSGRMVGECVSNTRARDEMMTNHSRCLFNLAQPDRTADDDASRMRYAYRLTFRLPICDQSFVPPACRPNLWFRADRTVARNSGCQSPWRRWIELLLVSLSNDLYHGNSPRKSYRYPPCRMAALRTSRFQSQLSTRRWERCCQGRS